MAEPERPVMGPEPPPAPDAAEPAPAPMSAGGPLDSSALFWGDGDNIDPDNPDMAALLALQEECTPEERAEAFKARAPRGSRARCACGGLRGCCWRSRHGRSY